MVLSLRALRDPGRFPLQLGWVRAVQDKVPGLNWAVLRWLVNETMGSPDFLTPRPTSPLTQLADELELIGETNRDTFERQMRAVNGELPARVTMAQVRDAAGGAHDGEDRGRARRVLAGGDGAVLGSDAGALVGRHQLSRARADAVRD